MSSCWGEPDSSLRTDLESVGLEATPCHLGASFEDEG